MIQDTYSLSDSLNELDLEYTELEKNRFSIYQTSSSPASWNKIKRRYYARLLFFDMFTDSYYIPNDIFLRKYQNEIIQEAKRVIKGGNINVLLDIPAYVETLRKILAKAAILVEEKKYNSLCMFAVDTCVFMITEFLRWAPQFKSRELGECIKKMNLIGDHSIYLWKLERILSEHKVDIRTESDIIKNNIYETGKESLGCFIGLVIFSLLAFLIATLLGAK